MKREAWQGIARALPRLIVAFAGMTGVGGWFMGLSQERIADEQNQAQKLLASQQTKLAEKTMQEAQPELSKLYENRIITRWHHLCLNNAATSTNKYVGNNYQSYVVDMQKYRQCLDGFASAPAATPAFTRTQGTGAGMAVGTGFAFMFPLMLWFIAGTQRFEQMWTPKPKGP